MGDAGENEVKCELAREILQSLGTLRMRVSGWSMLPTMRPGDFLVVEPSEAKQIAMGDVILFARGGRLIAHRVLRATIHYGNVEIVTQGDASPTPDSPVTAAQLLGKVTCVFRNGESIALCAGLSGGERLVAGAIRHSGLAGRLLAHLQTVSESLWRREAVCKS